MTFYKHFVIFSLQLFKHAVVVCVKQLFNNFKMYGYMIICEGFSGVNIEKNQVENSRSNAYR